MNMKTRENEVNREWLKNSLKLFLSFFSLNQYFTWVFSRQYLLCISTSEQVLRTQFAGWNRLYDAKTTISVTNGTKLTKKLNKAAQNHAKHAVKKGENSGTQKLVDSWEKCDLSL